MPRPYLGVEWRRKAKRDYNRRIYRERKELGLCTQCGEPAEVRHYKNGRVKQSIYCELHATENAIKTYEIMYRLPVEARRRLWREKVARWTKKHGKKFVNAYQRRYYRRCHGLLGAGHPRRCTKKS